MSAIQNVRNGEQSHGPSQTNSIAPAVPIIINPHVSESLQGDVPERDVSEMLSFGRIVKELQELASRRSDLLSVIADNQRNLPDRDKLAQFAEQLSQKANKLEEEARKACWQAEIAKQDLKSAEDKAETIESDMYELQLVQQRYNAKHRLLNIGGSEVALGDESVIRKLIQSDSVMK
nr:hypothetical protein B0A51_14028 [Rachicladosporium sp. CCFEE 5018]